MVFGSPAQRKVPAGAPKALAYAYAADTLRRVMPELAGVGVRICLEPLTIADTDFMNTCAEAVELMEMVGHPNCKLHLDAKAMCSETAPMPELIRRYGPRAGHFHANDPNLRGPGFGPLDFVPIFQALRDIAYDGYVSVEVFDYTPDPETIGRQSIEYMRRCEAAAREASDA